MLPIAGYAPGPQFRLGFRLTSVSIPNYKRSAVSETNVPRILKTVIPWWHGCRHQTPLTCFKPIISQRSFKKVSSQPLFANIGMASELCSQEMTPPQIFFSFLTARYQGSRLPGNGNVKGELEGNMQQVPQTSPPMDPGPRQRLPGQAALQDRGPKEDSPAEHGGRRAIAFEVLSLCARW
jgi:hypothetical protein